MDDPGGILPAGYIAIRKTSLWGLLGWRKHQGSATVDVVDAALMALAVDGDVVCTSDVGDLEHLAAIRGVEIRIVGV